jgi:DICT domain-containing protein
MSTGGSKADFAFAKMFSSTRMVLRSRRMMTIISHAIEEQAAASGPDTLLIATFQRLSLFLPELPRYTQLAQKLRRIVIVGVADVLPPEIPGVTILPIEASWPLVQEWVVLARGPGLACGLLATDSEGFQLERRSLQFNGLWTTNSDEVDAAIVGFLTMMGLPAHQVRSESHALLRNTASLQHEISTRLSRSSRRQRSS